MEPKLFMRMVSCAYWNGVTKCWEVRTEYLDSNTTSPIVSNHNVSADDCHVIPLAVEAAFGFEPSVIEDEWVEEIS